jgi:hypothetical protein
MSVLLGLLGLATLPVAIAVTDKVDGLSLVEAGFAIPAAVLLSLGAVVIGRHVRKRSRQTLAAVQGAGVARFGRVLALTATLAVAFYGLLTYVST